MSLNQLDISLIELKISLNKIADKVFIFHSDISLKIEFKISMIDLVISPIELEISKWLDISKQLEILLII